MSVKGKKHNSIIFLTTLSVYLGLVLVGASPQVFAQAALTRNFDIKTEIEIEDDLDKNPDEKALKKYSEAFQKLVSLAKEFSDKNQKTLRGGAYEFDCTFILRANDASRTTCEKDGGLFWTEFITPFREIVKAFPHTEKDDTEQAKFSLALSGTELVLKTTLSLDSSQQAAENAGFFDNILSQAKQEQFSDPQLVVYQNTEISAKNNQIFIVTRLPRASIDSLIVRREAE